MLGTHGQEISLIWIPSWHTYFPVTQMQALELWTGVSFFKNTPVFNIVYWLEQADAIRYAGPCKFIVMCLSLCMHRKERTVDPTDIYNLVICSAQHHPSPFVNLVLSKASMSLIGLGHWFSTSVLWYPFNGLAGFHAI